MSTTIKCSKCKNKNIYAAYRPFEGFNEWQYKIEKENAKNERNCSEYEVDYGNRLWQKIGDRFVKISSDDGEGINDYTFFCKCGHSSTYRYF